MASHDSAAAPGPTFTPLSKHVTKARLLIALSLALTWFIASLLPTYSPQIRAELSSRISDARQKIPKIKVDWEVEADPRAKFDQRKLALMIEPRPTQHLVPHMLYMMSVVPPDWRFMFIGTEKSVLSVSRASAIRHRMVTGKLDLMVLPEPWSVESMEHIYRTMTDMRFYDEFLPGVEWILKYESDSILCANSKSSLNNWLHWSWAGAPRREHDAFGGHGGLSLRRVSTIRRVLTFQQRYNDTDPEDEWFGKRLRVLPDELVATGDEGVLSVEDVYYEKPMGFHLRGGGEKLKDDVWKNPERRKAIFEYCPELSLIMDMKMERERCEDDNLEGGLGPTDAEKEAEEEKKKQEEERKKKEDEKERKTKEEERKKKEDEKERKTKEDEEREKAKNKSGAGEEGKPNDKANV